MKKSTLLFGEFIQYDRKFITAENGIEADKVTSVAFEGETPEWVTLEKTSGERGKNSVKLSFSENTDVTKTREAKLRLTSGVVSNIITIQQKPAVEE